ncbi:MAG TPA: hypothetical protein DCY94_05005, partial [Firmicutes bacterium]|nr:hypothetical protein [Bacillota bacterium]
MAIKEPRDDYFQLINEMAEKELLLYLKNKFSPYHYYALYHGVLSPDRKTYGEIGKSLLLDHNTIASIIHRDLGILRAKGKLDYRYVGVDADFLSTKPVEPIQIVKYYFFRDTLDEDEKKLFRLITSSKYVDDVRVYARVLGWDISYCSLVMNRVTEKTRLDNPRVVEIFESFR